MFNIDAYIFDYSSNIMKFMFYFLYLGSNVLSVQPFSGSVKSRLGALPRKELVVPTAKATVNDDPDVIMDGVECNEHLDVVEHVPGI